MSRKSGHRFSEKDMRKRKNLERISIQSKRDALLVMPKIPRSPDKIPCFLKKIP